MGRFDHPHDGFGLVAVQAAMPESDPEAEVGRAAEPARSVESDPWRKSSPRKCCDAQQLAFGVCEGIVAGPEGGT